MTCAELPWAESPVRMEITDAFRPVRCQVGSWPGRADLCFGWTLESKAESLSSAQICFRLADTLDRVPACLRQVHGDTIVVADELWPAALWDPPVGDGLITARRDLLMGVSVADCAPVFLAFTGGVAVLHAGWRSIVARILPGAVELIDRRWGVPASDIELILGPCIGPCCFAVSAAVAALFPPHVRRRHGERLHVDLPGTLLDQWLSAGGQNAHFLRLDRCTVCGTPAMFSHRRAPNEGRNFAFVYRPDRG